MTETRTTCPYCGVGCGVVASVSGDQIQIRGDQHHPSNFGKLCSKGVRLAETLGVRGRLMHPSIKGERDSWSRTLAYVGHKFRQAVDQHGPDSVAFYLSGQLLTEDYYVANKLMKGFIGSANVDTNSRLCMSSAVAAHKRGLGSDSVPGCYEDFELADLVVLVGSNMSWCHPVLFQRLQAARRARPRMRLVVIDPRRTATAEAADQHLAIRPGGDLALFHGLLRFLIEQGQQRPDAHQLPGWSDIQASLQAYDLARVARETDLNRDDIVDFYRQFATSPQVVTGFSMGINQSEQGVDQGNAILNCHLVTDRIGRPGMGPFSLTGQPNAMGGREVGGLANTLAAHRELDDEAARQAIAELWCSPQLASRPGLKAVELFEAMERGQIKAVWIMGTNPAVSLPDSGQVARALQACPLVVVSDCVSGTDTQRYADVLLPATGWGEKAGTVTNSERRLSRQRAFLPASGEARADWWMLCQMAKAMGFNYGFNFTNEADIFREHAALSAINGRLGGAFDIGALATLTDQQYQQLAPLQWPQPAGQPLQLNNQRLFASHPASPPQGQLHLSSPVTSPAPAGWVLNNGRYRDQWHTMTRTGLSSQLGRHRPWPEISLHPDDARLLDVTANDLLTLEAGDGTLRLPVALSAQQRRGELFAPIHWSGQYSGQAAVNAVVGRGRDSLSGQPGFKGARVQALAVTVRVWAQLWLPEPVALPQGVATFWASQTHSQGRLYLLASELSMSDCVTRLGQLLEELGHGQPSASQASAQGSRHLYVEHERLLAGVFVSPQRRHLPGDYLQQALQSPFTAAHQRSLLMTPTTESRLLCCCLQLTEADIDAAIAEGADSADKVADVCGAGTGCGSCRGEVMERCRLAKNELETEVQNALAD
ncbi:assimilatory nitrate reductase (NADH) alpha subunit apoprotein [Ferrimonas sediminum]|uniref:Assimilatory nitrate reductase (NADH) alpha subunit apoprotein n=1 Tax=Ferrimonas sediminum TaxID=718193 RepID=A0A1G8XLK5_9GAMM|nr:nitrate reductase [Ferrimonas sediminum]SDJ91363.1 assimilatory nitrate reductase (NADH) alpha subunit apoprotein [Ferrimonas sediminum]